MLFQQLEQFTKINNTTLNKKNVKYCEKVLPSVKLQCIICSDTFNVNTEHICLMRESNQKFTLNTRYARI